MRNKLTSSQLKMIIAEEINSVLSESIDADFDAEGAVFTTANNFLKAIATFKKKSNPNMIPPEVEKCFKILDKHLNNMRSAPSEYVLDTTIAKTKKVTLKPVNTDKIILLFHDESLAYNRQAILWQKKKNHKIYLEDSQNYFVAVHLSRRKLRLLTQP